MKGVARDKYYNSIKLEESQAQIKINYVTKMVAQNMLRTYDVK